MVVRQFQHNCSQSLVLTLIALKSLLSTIFGVFNLPHAPKNCLSKIGNQAMALMRKLAKNQSSLSKKQRLQCFSPQDILTIRTQFPRLILLLAVFGYGCILGAPVADLVDDIREVKDEITKAMWFDSADFASIPRNPNSKITSVDRGVALLGTREFVHLFGAVPKLVKKLALLLFPNDDGGELFSFRLRKYQTVNAEEALMLVLCRLRHSTATQESLGWRLSLSEQHVQANAAHAAKLLFGRFNYLFDLNRLNRFSMHAKAWSDAVLAAYNRVLNRKGRHSESVLPDRFEQGNLFVDCVRTYLSRPSSNQEAFYNGWITSHSIVRAAVMEPGGLFLALSLDYEGRHNDAHVARESDMAYYIVKAGFHAITDKGFANVPGMAAFYKIGQAHNMFLFQQKGLSVVRTAGAEWPFGQLQMLFPFMVQVLKQKINISLPTVWFRVACLLSNLIRISQGCNNNIFYNLQPFIRVEDYLTGRGMSEGL